LFPEMLGEGFQNFGQAFLQRRSGTVGTFMDVKQVETQLRLDHRAECPHGECKSVLKPAFIVGYCVPAPGA
jgi:hypothetical protein